ncbi:D-aminopeptidase [Usitatibacter rugosus]|uniref:D-aminopeptidase n=1 Tax=Usitatibacter rugosus TaxID=2732067 RepID=A0A6M4GTJ3_9PROT|nr:serine hydrolase [Usitatibacter rugosus]QJR10362.1 D-aminopeptidase [Usitatibacter rugosus]
MIRILTARLLRIAAGLACLAFTGAALAQPAREAKPLTAADLEAWFDGVMPTTLKITGTPGVTISVVKDGQVLFEKGYGYADMEKLTPVDARTTLFRPGSVSKLFTWTAVMQQVEAGKLDLDADVNKYLDFQIPAYDGKPLTLRNIMTHRTGFEEVVKDLITFTGEGPTDEQTVKKYIPPRIYPPGTVAGYSNYATSLAGYIVQRVSGEPFQEYLERHIFVPLGMKNSTFRQPLPEAMRANMSVGYKDVDNKGDGFEIISMPAAGSLTSTADDMAKFMIAHLNNGAGLLKPETAKQMHEFSFRTFPELNGNALGFYEQTINGRRAIAHGGDTVYFHSELLLFPAEKVGLFMSVNGGGRGGMGARARYFIVPEFADRYFPRAETFTPVDAKTAKEHAQMIAGRYKTSRRADSTFISLATLAGVVTLTANADDTISHSILGFPVRYREVKPFVWQEIGGHDKLQATVVDGKVVSWTTDMLAFAFSFEPQGGLAGAGLAIPLVGLAVVLILLGLFAWPIRATALRAAANPRVFSRPKVLAIRAGRVFAILTLGALVAWAALFVMALQNLTPKLDTFLFASQALACVAFFGGWLVAAWNLVLDVRGRLGWKRIAWSAAILFAFTMLVWLGWNYGMLKFYSQF